MLLNTDSKSHNHNCMREAEEESDIETDVILWGRWCHKPDGDMRRIGHVIA